MRKLEIIKIVLEKQNMSDKITEIQPVPYEDGNHCIFYAIQNATMFFYNKPLTVDERDEYQSQNERFVKISKYFLKDRVSTHWLTLSLRIIADRLGKKSISITKIICEEETKKFLENDNFIKRSNIPITGVKPNSEIELEFPSLIITHGNNGLGNPHVWCPTSEEEFNKNYSKHISALDNINVVATIEKSTST